MDCTDTRISIKDLSESIEIFDKLMLYIYTSVWVLCTPNVVQIYFYPCFCTFLQDFVAKMNKTCFHQFSWVLDQWFCVDLFFHHLCIKVIHKPVNNMDKEIFPSVLGMHRPNAGQNVQHIDRPFLNKNKE